MIFGMIEKERFEKVLEEGTKLMNITKEDFQRIMETDFMAAFVTGYYGHGVLMGNAAKAYFEEIETELFAELEDLLPMKPASEKIADDTFDSEVIEAEAVAVTDIPEDAAEN